VNEYVVFTPTLKIRQCFPVTTSSVQLLQALDKCCLLLFKKLDIFFAVGPIVWSALPGIHTDRVVESTSVAMALAVALCCIVSVSMVRKVSGAHLDLAYSTSITSS